MPKYFKEARLFSGGLKSRACVSLTLSQTLPRVKPFADLAARRRQPDYKRIFVGLRAQIVGGKLQPGTQLPSTRDLAKTWQSNFLTVHTALSALTREGWLDRRHGSGTYIADPRFRLSCAGIYHGS